MKPQYILRLERRPNIPGRHPLDIHRYIIYSTVEYTKALLNSLNWSPKWIILKTTQPTSFYLGSSVITIKEKLHLYIHHYEEKTKRGYYGVLLELPEIRSDIEHVIENIVYYRVNGTREYIYSKRIH